MSQKPENVFRNSVHRHLPPHVYQCKMSNMYNAGIADDWYSGDKTVTGKSSDLWIEYKFLPKVPLRAAVWLVNPNVKAPMLSALQARWLNDRLRDGRNVAVICGCPDGGVILRNQEWMQPIEVADFRERLLPRKALAQWITEQTTR